MPVDASPWPSGAATGAGPFPGTDPAEAARIVFATLPQLPHLPVLPARGPGSDAIGRTAALLVDLHVDVQPDGWRLVPRPGRDERRARSMLDADLDALEEAGDGYEGPFKVQVVGPWTLAAGVALPRGEKALADDGAVRDLVASLADGLAAHVADIGRRLPGARPLVVQVDEPRLPAVLAGRVPTQSGWGRLRAVEEPAALEALRPVVAAAAGAGVAGLRFGAATAPPALVRRAGARFLGVDAGLLGSLDEDDLGEALETGMGLLVGVGPLTAVAAASRSAVEPLLRTWHRLGLAPGRLAEAAVIMPVDGLEHLGRDAAVDVLRGCVKLGRLVEEAAHDS